MESYLKGQPYILLIKMESKFHEMGISIRERKKWLLCLLIFGYEALIQVDKGFVMGRQARGKGMFALVPVNHFESRFH